MKEVGWPEANTKVIQKNCLEFENNAVNHTIFAVQPACWLGPY